MLFQVKAHRGHLANPRDACPGTKQYLELDMKCRDPAHYKIPKHYACENTWLKTECEEGTLIQVKKAVWGRSVSDTYKMNPLDIYLTQI